MAERDKVLLENKALQVLKGLLTNSFTLSSSTRAAAPKNLRVMKGVAELTSFRAKAEGAGVRVVHAKNRNACLCHCSYVEPSPNPACRHRWGLNLNVLLT